MSLRRFLRLLLDKNWQPPTVDDSLAKTAKDALHSRGPGMGGSGSLGSYGATDAVYKHIAEGHENYAKSFKKKDG